MASESDYLPTSGPANPSAPESAALRFGRYEVARRPDGAPFELGRGGMGVTYKAIDPELRRAVVLKVISPMLLGNDPLARARFQREARSAAGVHHPHIATIFDIGEERGEDYYVMEFIEGEDLLTRIRRDGPLDSTAVLRIARQVAGALEAAWEQGIVHRDIKPANLMVARRPAAREAREGPLVKVVDFGLAKALKVAGAASDGSVSSMMTVAAQAIFSPAYASPEQIEDGELDIRSDLYSLGVTLWQLLCGAPTFGDASKQRTIVGHLSKEPPFDDLRAVHVPENVIELLGELLEKVPVNRPATPEAVLEKIDLLLDRHTAAVTEPIAHPHEPEPPHLQPPPSPATTTTADDSFPLVDVLRRRGALPIEEVLLLLDALAPLVDAIRRGAPAVIPNLDPSVVLIRFEAPAADLNSLPASLLSNWPAFALDLSAGADASASQQMMPDQTMMPSGGRFQSENAVQAVGALVYELLDGQPPAQFRYRPLGALNEEANAVLRVNLEGEAGYRTAAEFVQTLRAALNNVPAPVRREPSAMKTMAARESVYATGGSEAAEAPPKVAAPPPVIAYREPPPPPPTPPPGREAARATGTGAVPVARKRGSALGILAGLAALGAAAALAFVFWPKPGGGPVEKPPDKPAPTPDPAIAQQAQQGQQAQPSKQAQIDRLLDEADAAYFSSDWKQSVEKCTAALVLAPDALPAYSRRGQAYSRLGDSQRATEDWSKAVAISSPTTARAYSSRGQAYSALGQNDKSIADCSKAIELDPKYAPAYHNRGLAYNGLSRKEEALADYNKAIAIDPRYAPAYNSRGNISNDLSKKEEALADYSKAVALSPAFAPNYNNRSLVFYGLRRFDEALADCTRAIELDPKFTLAYNIRGVIYDGLDQKEKALADYSKAIEIDPKFAPAYKNRSLLYAKVGDLLHSKQDSEKVNELARTSGQ